MFSKITCSKNSYHSREFEHFYLQRWTVFVVVENHKIVAPVNVMALLLFRKI
jgi:hypothetical protein